MPLDVAKLNGMLSHLAQQLGRLERLREEVTVIEVEELYRVLQEDIEDLRRFAQIVVALLRGEK